MSEAPYDAIVVGSDGSQTSFRAVQRAGLYGEALGVEVVVATVFHRPTEEEIGPPSERAKMPKESVIISGYQGAAAIAGDAAQFARKVAPNAPVQTTAVEGDPAEALIELAESRGESLLVVGNQGMTGSKRFLLGSVPNKVSHHAVGDVLITRTDEQAEIRLPRTVLLATDGSKTASAALRRGLALAAGVGADVTVLTAGMGHTAQRIVDDAAALAEQADVTCRPLIADGPAADAIVSAAEDHDLVVVGNRGMTGSKRFLLGSVPNRVSHHVGSDLLIVRTT